MANKTIQSVLAITLLLAATVAFVFDREALHPTPPTPEAVHHETTISAPPTTLVQPITTISPLPDTINTEPATPTLTQLQIQQTLQEINTRLTANQTDEALNELNGLLQTYESMTVDEKTNLLTAYASFFLKNSQNADAAFFYEQILQLPDIKTSNRLPILQMLARIAMNSEDWNGFLDYNDQYFNEGGEYNWMVTEPLVTAYLQLSDDDAAGQALLLHINHGITPKYDGSDEKYQQYYGESQYLPLRMSDSAAALVLAERLVDQFDRAENWQVLSLAQERMGDKMAYEKTMMMAGIRGFLDEYGNWLVPTAANK